MFSLGLELLSSVASPESGTPERDRAERLSSGFVEDFCGSFSESEFILKLEGTISITVGVFSAVPLCDGKEKTSFARDLSSFATLLELDPEIERTFWALRRQARSAATCERSILEMDNKITEGDRTMKELAAPDVAYKYSCITYPDLAGDFELRSRLIHLLPKFQGLSGEDPNRHLHEFHVVCSTMKTQGISEEDIKLRAFPFSLTGAAKDWLYCLPAGFITNWIYMKKAFLEKFFPASRTATIRKSICGIQQVVGETLYDYWERFKKLCSSCPQNQISDQLLVQYFYEGLLPMDRSMIDATAGGALVNKTPNQARELISNMAENSQQFGSRALGTRVVNETHLVSTEQQEIRNSLQELTSLVKQMALQNSSHVSNFPLPMMKLCGICASQITLRIIVLIYIKMNPL
ncbi:uncharacterized protein LOC122012902 [Zingiber officinale]|uniref:uncharacterized protein LOC122012902 n=1 Tax=Zingiber officinale TaxID=94328 RepID=UPI001C4AB639|nr:uncharacterized protein LOC122012902 [Zingiber officinale]XP_042425503.1 uncharacterized protein LOC122012902 [Zingiber officinale]